MVIIEAGRAVGVVVSTSDGRAEFRASAEVILSLGSLASPRLLQLSGIGDRRTLQAVGIRVHADSPNVGRRMLEHRCVALQYRMNKDVGYNRDLSTPIRQAITGIKYLATKRGPLAGGAYDVTLRNAAGAGVHIEGDIKMASFTVWGIRRVLAAEPFVNLKAAPGQTLKWRYRYTYSAAGATP